MKAITQEASISLKSGRVVPVNNADGKSLGCYKPILERIENQMAAVLSHHSKMLVAHVVLHCHGYVPDNHLISGFMKQLKAKLPKGYERLGCIGHIWARETGTSGNTHYHLALLLNGNAICSSKKLSYLCKELWQDKAGQGQVQTSWHHARSIRRGDDAAFDETFYWLSYLAKVYSKGQRKPTANDYSSSQIKLKIAKDKVSAARFTTTPETGTAPHCTPSTAACLHSLPVPYPHHHHQPATLLP